MWTSLEEDAYLHPGKPCAQAMVITVTGVPDASMAGINVLLVGRGSAGGFLRLRFKVSFCE